MRELLDFTEELGMRMIHAEHGFADPEAGELLQLDGVFFRDGPATEG
jgi:hypothetical protein